MKHIIFSLLFAVTLLPACNNKKKTAENADEKKDAATEQIQEATDEIQKRTEALQELTPLTSDELKALLPEELIGAKMTTSQANSVNGTALAKAQYVLNDSAELQVSISDCGGAGGAGYYNRQAINMLNRQAKADGEDTKTVEFRDGDALQRCNSNETVCSFTYFDTRYWVIIEGRNIPPGDLKSAAKDLKLK